ncbi:tyrosine-type recombinase/integrase [Gilliamella sp. Pra-s65]|uniref:tyrosine-type recombinase/integrase n=1 Tax=unclassified Gilliamella TaxID=2685620 RepID=UPI001365EC3E|nr:MULTISPECIES: tyrosine-type recombinase/integrase [unclassified Gilliamella]MWN89254.1 tyrosine-type recombinase/integrase [Gilliamella sp. Pra-s65]MWP72297.1 tyrosine-type recombinase/integrase [Gilliamella sp. Pra-s52]
MKKKLLDLNLRNAKPKNKDYYLNDGDGLYLLVKTTGAKLWRFKYVHPITKKQKMMSLGKYPAVSFADVRVKKQQYLDLLKEKIDPMAFEKNEELKKIGNEASQLRNVFKEWFELKKQENKVTEKHLRKIESSFTKYILNKDIELAHKQIKDCKATDFDELIKSCGKTDLIKRLCEYLNNVFDFAVIKNYIEYNKIQHLKKILPTHTPTPRPTLPPAELPNILKTVNNANLERSTKLLMYFQLITLSRPAEAVKCEWSEIDFENKIWTIKAKKMKMRRDHIVPLPELAINILNEMKEADFKNNYVFSSTKTKSGHISLETANNALKRLGYKGILVAHGFRSLASTALNESGLFNPDIIELSLAHVDKNTVRATYNKALYLDKRREMLEWWADYIKNAGKFSIF